MLTFKRWEGFRNAETGSEQVGHVNTKQLYTKGRVTEIDVNH